MKLRLLPLITLLVTVFISHFSWAQPAQKLALSPISQPDENLASEDALPETDQSAARCADCR